MGNCVSGEEDLGMSKMQHMAVGAGADAITDEALGLLDQNAGLKQKVGLTFSCSDLPNLDARSKTDAFIVLWSINGR